MDKVELLEKWGEPQKVLDHGQVRLVDVMGDDGAIVQAARVSYGRGLSMHEIPDLEATCKVCGYVRPLGFNGEPVSNSHCVKGDRKLIRSLMSRRHTTPFEHCKIKLHAKMPIFVARQWVRHRTASINEISGRYTMLPDEFYVPARERVGGKGTANKQGTSGTLPGVFVESFRDQIAEDYAGLRESYEIASNAGVANELARFHTGVNQYTEWYWTTDLHNLFHFLSLRMDPHAQWEMQQYALVIWEIVKDWVPFAAEAFEEYRLGAASLSASQVALLQHLVDHLMAADALADVPEENRLSDKRCRQALCERFGIETDRERAAFWRTLGVIS